MFRLPPEHEVFVTGVITVRPIGRREGGARNERQLRGVDAFTYTDCMLQVGHIPVWSCISDQFRFLFSKSGMAIEQTAGR